jgi:predicted choloylglycine hydrolase
MYHPRFRGSPYDMGQKMGNIFKKANAQFPIRLDSFQTKFGRESGKLLERYFPEAAAEIRGVTDVIGIDNELFTSWMMCMGCCMDLQEGASVEVRGCTAFSFVHECQVYHARDNDLPPFLREVCKSIYYQPEGKYSFILNTSSFINGEEGINQHGLVAAMTFVVPRLEEIRPGINSVFLVRFILENCMTVAEGIEALGRLPVASSCNILLTDRSGSMVVAECHPQGIHLRQPETDKNGETFIVAVNHFTSEEMRPHDASDRNVFSSAVRYQTAYQALKDTNYKDGVMHARRILSGEYGFMCQYGKNLDFDTIWSSVFDISNRRIYRAEGNPKNKPYKEDTRLDWAL